MSTKRICDGCGKGVSPVTQDGDHFKVTYEGMEYGALDTSPRDYCVACMNTMVHLLHKHLSQGGHITGTSASDGLTLV